MRQHKLVALTAAAVVGTAVASGTTSPSAGSAPSSVAPTRVLIYGPSLAGGGAQFNEARAARSLGYRVAIADPIAWNALDEGDFAQYDAIIIGDTACTKETPKYLRPAARTNASWTPAVTGNVAVVGTDPVFHVRHGSRDTRSSAQRLVLNGLQHATSGATTGAYLALGCAYVNAPEFTPVRALSGFGPFTARGQHAPPLGGCPDKAEIAQPLSPLVDGLDDGDLSDWGCSIHAGVDSFPAPFEVVAAHRRSDLPYLLTRTPSTAPTSDRSTVFPGAGSDSPSRAARPMTPNVAP